MVRQLLLTGLGLVAATNKTNSPKCSVWGTYDGDVVPLTDGEYERCMSLITPKREKPMPVLFNFHGAGGSGAGCGSGDLGKLAEEGGFALICGEALQDIFDVGGQWNIPEIITDATGNPCTEADSLDIAYIKNALHYLDRFPALYDTSRTFFTGCSMGSAFTTYISTCMKQERPESISAMATHSSGLKVKGDGLTLPPDNYHKFYTWGECPGCQYFPFKPTAWRDPLGLKACVFDNTGDGDFYKTSVQLAQSWRELGNEVETHYGLGGHCMIHSYAAIVNCLDGGSRRLLVNGPLPESVAVSV